MAFFNFGKKNPPQSPKPGTRKPGQPAAAVPSSAKEQAHSEPAQPAAAVELPALEFTADAGAEHEPEDQIQLRDSVSVGHPAIEEAAILYANGQDAMALAAIEAALADNPSVAAADQLWAMLFDLYLLKGDREAFEVRALAYSLQLEKSPPTWVDASGAARQATANAGSAQVTFGPALNADSDKAVKQLDKMVCAGPQVRVDLGKIQSADDVGCTLLLGSLKAARKRKCGLVLSGADGLINLLAARAVPDRREHEAAWLLLLELHQQLGRQEAFEERALQYAVTFEVSPPWWEKPPALPRKNAAAPARSAEPDAYCLVGEIHGGQPEPLQRLQDYAQERVAVAIDCVSLRRVDFVTGGMLLNTLTGLQRQGKTVRLSGVNAMVYALFGVLGITQAAQVERRKL